MKKFSVVLFSALIVMGLLTTTMAASSPTPGKSKGTPAPAKSKGTPAPIKTKATPTPAKTNATPAPVKTNKPESTKPVYKDGSYVGKSTPNDKGEYYQLSVTLKESKITDSKLSYYSGGKEMTSLYLLFVFGDTKKNLKGLLDTCDNYASQLKDKQDGDKVTAYSFDAAGTILAAFKEAWNNIVAQAK